MLNTKKRFQLVINYFSENNAIAETELHYNNAFELLVAVILSAQCTDKRVNIITPPLLKKYSDPEKLASATQEEVFELIKSCSYPNNKAKNLIGMAKGLIELFQGEMPSDIDDLQKLPGVGRKTANVIASVVFNKPAMAVDTHVFRVSERIGLTTNSRNPLQTEMQLIKYIPAEKIPIAHHWLILHGRYICKARKPNCFECGIKEYCRYYANK